MTRGWRWVSVPDAADSALSIIQSPNPSCPLTLIATKAPNTLLHFFCCFTVCLSVCTCVYGCVCAHSGDEKASNDHGCVANHPWCEAITASSLSSCHLRYLCPTSPNPQPLTVTSLLPSIIPTSLVRELGWHLVGPHLSYPFPLSLNMRLSPTHYSQFTG